MSQTAKTVEVIRRIGAEIAGPHAAEVDRDARFPKETVDALREARLLGAPVPVELGGPGVGLEEVADGITALARYCASSAMILAMHHAQVACLVRHGHSDALRGFARRLVDEQLLLASATTEIGIGDARSSSCSVQVSDADPEAFTLHKVAPVISYGAYADAVLVTARRDASAPADDQVLVLAERSGTDLRPISGWDTLGFRGTCSLGFELTATGPISHVCDDPFATISTQTLLPVSHLLWSALWRGIADEAVARARSFVRRALRRSSGTTTPGAARLAELVVVQQQLAESVSSMLRRYVAIADDPAATATVDFMVAINTLKVSASTLVVDIVNKAMLICGISGYREDSAHSLGRLLRDAHGAAVMVNNDRIAGNTAQLLLADTDRA